MSFAAQLKKSRLRKSYSLQKLADIIDASKAHIWDLETGRAKNPSLEILQKLSTALDTPIAKLIGENPESDDAVVLYRDLQALLPEDRETIMMMMGRLKKRKQD